MEQNTSLAWWVVVVALILFWPIGIILLIRKLATDKSAMMGSGVTIINIVGWVLIVLGALFALAAIPSSSSTTTTGADRALMAVLGLVMVVGGILLLMKVASTKKTAARYRKYLDLIVNNNVTSLDMISSALATPYSDVAKDLQQMVAIGYLKNAYIDQGRRAIYIQRPAPVYQAPAPVAYGSAPAPTPQITVVKCPGCGSNNHVQIGTAAVCAYCDNPLKA